MNVIVTTPHRFKCTRDGAVWTKVGFSAEFFKRYLEVFSSVTVVARVKSVNEISDNYQRANGDSISFIPLPYYIGPLRFAFKYPAISSVIRKVSSSNSAFIIRAGDMIAYMLEERLYKMNKPYALEIVGDPDETFSPGSMSHPLREIFRSFFTKAQMIQCSRAPAVSYVTRETLQKKYPPSPDAITAAYSSIDLPDTAIRDSPREFRNSEIPLRLIHVGSMETLYKGQDVLLKAAEICRDQSNNIRIVLVGDGKMRPKLERLARSLKIEDTVHFAGSIPSGAEVRSMLEDADLFVLPSRQEGLPRAMIEAMATGLPCIGSTAGGIPELLEPQEMAPVNDPEALADLMSRYHNNSDLLTTASQRNLAKAREYNDNRLRAIRTGFYAEVKRLSAEYFAGRLVGGVST